MKFVHRLHESVKYQDSRSEMRDANEPEIPLFGGAERSNSDLLLSTWFDFIFPTVFHVFKNWSSIKLLTIKLIAIKLLATVHDR